MQVKCLVRRLDEEVEATVYQSVREAYDRIKSRSVSEEKKIGDYTIIPLETYE